MMVGFSHYDAGFAAISHILAQGRRRIGFLGARMDPRVQRRFEGYRDAMKAASLFDPNLVVTTTVPTTVTLGRHAVRRPRGESAGYRRGVLRQRRPCAWACCSNASAGRSRFPASIAIVGFNDLEFMASAVPSLTSVRTNRYEMGRHAVTMVIDGDRGPPPAAAGPRPRLSTHDPRKFDGAGRMTAERRAAGRIRVAQENGSATFWIELRS